MNILMSVLPQGITVDDDYCRKLADFTKEYFEADFSENGMFWDKVKISYPKLVTRC